MDRLFIEGTLFGNNFLSNNSSKSAVDNEIINQVFLQLSHAREPRDIFVSLLGLWFDSIGILIFVIHDIKDDIKFTLFYKEYSFCCKILILAFVRSLFLYDQGDKLIEISVICDNWLALIKNFEPFAVNRFEVLRSHHNNFIGLHNFVVLLDLMAGLLLVRFGLWDLDIVLKNQLELFLVFKRLIIHCWDKLNCCHLTFIFLWALFILGLYIELVFDQLNFDLQEFDETRLVLTGMKSDCRAPLL